MRARLALLLLVAVAGSHVFGDVSGDPSERVTAGGSGNAELDRELDKLQSLLTWALDNSNPEDLPGAAERLQADDLEERRKDLEALVEVMKERPSESQLMMEALQHIVNNATATDDVEALLDEVAVLVEPINNANDLLKMGGANAIMLRLRDSHIGIQAAAAGVISAAASNNPEFATGLLESNPQVVEALMGLLRGPASPARGRALAALGQLLRSAPGRGVPLFDALEGPSALARCVSDAASNSPSVRRRALHLMMDLMREGATASVETAAAATDEFAPALVAMLNEPDLPMRESALNALAALSQHSTLRGQLTHAGAEDALETLEETLQREEDASDDEDMTSYLAEVKELVDHARLQFSAMGMRRGGRHGHGAAHDEL